MFLLWKCKHFFYLGGGICYSKKELAKKPSGDTSEVFTLQRITYYSFIVNFPSGITVI